MNHVAAAELLVNPSFSESSNQAVKEAGILGKTCIVCDTVGDFNEFIIDKHNGFLVAKEDPLGEICNILREYYNKKVELKEMGERLRKEVLTRFDIRKTAEEYLRVGGISHKEH